MLPKLTIANKTIAFSFEHLSMSNNRNLDVALVTNGSSLVNGKHNIDNNKTRTKDYTKTMDYN